MEGNITAKSAKVLRKEKTKGKGKDRKKEADKGHKEGE